MTDADEVVRLVIDVLGDDVLGAYLHGSAVLGGLRPQSDIDVLVVLRRQTTAGERREARNGCSGSPAPEPDAGRRGQSS